LRDKDGEVWSLELPFSGFGPGGRGDTDPLCCFEDVVFYEDGFDVLGGGDLMMLAGCHRGSRGVVGV